MIFVLWNFIQNVTKIGLFSHVGEIELAEIGAGGHPDLANAGVAQHQWEVAVVLDVRQVNVAAPNVVLAFLEVREAEEVWLCCVAPANVLDELFHFEVTQSAFAKLFIVFVACAIEI